MPYAPTEEELKKASDLLFYEMWMFQTLSQGIASGISGESVINNALLESYAIHVRALLHFFYGEEARQEEDITAGDFFASKDEWVKARPAISEALQEARSTAAREIAQLSYAHLRISPDEKGWDFVNLYNEMSKVIEAFLGAVPKQLLGERWNEFKGQGKEQG